MVRPLRGPSKLVDSPPRSLAPGGFAGFTRALCESDRMGFCWIPPLVTTHGSASCFAVSRSLALPPGTCVPIISCFQSAGESAFLGNPIHAPSASSVRYRLERCPMTYPVFDSPAACHWRIVPDADHLGARTVDATRHSLPPRDPNTAPRGRCLCGDVVPSQSPSGTGGVRSLAAALASRQQSVRSPRCRSGTARAWSNLAHDTEHRALPT